MAENININPQEDPVYRKKIYKFLTDNFDDFKVAEQDFYKKLDTDQTYAPKVYKVIKDNFSDFERPEQDFLFLMNPSKKKEQPVSGQELVKFPRTSGEVPPSQLPSQLPLAGGVEPKSDKTVAKVSPVPDIEIDENDPLRSLKIKAYPVKEMVKATDISELAPKAPQFKKLETEEDLAQKKKETQETIEFEKSYNQLKSLYETNPEYAISHLVKATGKSAEELMAMPINSLNGLARPLNETDEVSIGALKKLKSAGKSFNPNSWINGKWSLERAAIAFAAETDEDLANYIRKYSQPVNYKKADGTEEKFTIYGNPKDMFKEGTLGLLVAKYLSDPFVKAQAENSPFAAEYEKSKQEFPNTYKKYYSSYIANKVSDAYDKSGKRGVLSRVGQMGTQTLFDEMDEVAKQTLPEDEYNYYKSNIKGHESEYVDVPTMLGEFAGGVKTVGKGILSTFTEPFVSSSERQKENWEEQATMVSANPKGVWRFLNDASHMAGFVAGMAVGGGALRAGEGFAQGALGTTAAMSPTAVNMTNTGLVFFGDNLKSGKLKYPNEPVKAVTSAAFNTALFMALSKDLFPVKQVQSGIKTVQPEIDAVVNELTAGAITKEAAKAKLRNVGTKLIETLSGGLKQNIKASGEMGVLTGLSKGLDDFMGLSKEKQSKFYSKNPEADAAINMFMGNAFVSAWAGYGKMRYKNMAAINSYFDAASRPDFYRKVVNEGEAPNETKQEILDNIDFVESLKRELDAKGMSKSKQKAYIADAIAAKTLKSQKSTDENIQKSNDANLNEIKADQDELLKNPEDEIKFNDDGWQIVEFPTEEGAEIPGVPLSEFEARKKEEGAPSVPETEKENKRAELEYSIQQFEEQLNSKISDLVSKGATAEEAKQLAYNELSDKDRNTYEKLKQDLADLEVGEVKPEVPAGEEVKREVPQPTVEQQKESVAAAIKDAGADVTPEQLDAIYNEVIAGDGKIEPEKLRGILQSGYTRASMAADFINELGVKPVEVKPEVAKAGEVAPEVPAAAPVPSIVEVKSPKEVKQGDTVVWRGEDFKVEEVNNKGGFNLRNVKDPTNTVKDARITDEEFQGKRGEVAPASKLERFGVGFAPFREKNVFTESEDVDIRNSPDYKLHQENVQKVAEGLGIKINNKLDTWGGYIDSETGRPVQEVSNIMEIEATPEQARVMAAILGKAAPEMQDSVLLGNYNEQGAGLEHIVKTGSFANAKEAIKLLKDNDLQYFSVDKNSGDVIILDLDATDTPKIVNLVKQLNENGIPAKHKYGKVNAEFIGSGDYDGIIEAERGRIGTETGFDIDAFVQEAAGKYDAIKAAAKPVVPEVQQSIADKVRGLKIDLSKLGGGGAQSNIAGLPVALYNTVLEAVALAVEAGVSINKAIKDAIVKYNLNKQEGFDEDAFASSLLKKSKSIGSEDSPVYFDNLKKFASESSFANKIEFKKAIQNLLQSYLPKLKEKYGKAFKPSDYNDNTKKYLSDVLTKEALNAISEHPEAIGWYDDKTQSALDVISAIHPEIATDSEARGAFILPLAVMSNGNKVDFNFDLAEKQYDYFKKNGRFNPDGNFGLQQSGIKKSLLLINSLLDNGLTMSDINRFLTSKYRAGDLKVKIDGKVKNLASGELADEPVYGATILGPKIGNGFYMNLWGQFDQLTMDRWFMRTWGRHTGTLLEIDKQAISDGKKRLSDAINNVKSDPDALSKLKSVVGKLSGMSSVDLAKSIEKASMDKDKRAILASNPKTDELRKAGNSLSKTISGEKEAPANGKERKFIRDVFNDVVARLKNEQGIDISMADLQAALWYPEKILYESFKGGKTFEEAAEGYTSESAPDYLNAAKKLATKLGINETEINQALSRGRERTERGIGAADTRTGAAASEFDKGILGRVTEAIGGPKGPEGLEKAAKTVRSLKIKQGGLQSNIAGIPIALYNAALETIATALEAGASIKDAIDKAIEKHQLNKQKGFNVEGFIKPLEDASGQTYPKVGGNYAVQIETTGEVPVQPKAGVGQKVEGRVPATEPQKLTKEGKVEGEEGEIAPPVPPTEKAVEQTPEPEEWSGIRKEKLKEIEGAKKLFEKQKKVTWNETFQSALENVQKMFPKKSLYDAMKSRVNELSARVAKGEIFNPSSEDLAVFSVYKAETERKIKDVEGLDSDNPILRDMAILELEGLNEELISTVKLINPEEAGRAFAFRKSEIMLDENNGLKIRKMQLQRAKGGEPLTSEEEAFLNQNWEKEKALLLEEQKVREDRLKAEFDAKLDAVQKEFEENLAKVSKTPAGRTKKEKTLSQRGKDVANSLRKLKTNKNGLKLDFTLGTWDLAIEGIAQLVEKGATIAEAIETLIKNKTIGFKNQNDKDKFEALLVDKFNQKSREEQVDKIKDFASQNGATNLTKEMVSKNLIRDYFNSLIGEYPKNELFNEAYKELKEILPDITKDGLREAFLRTGDFKQPTRKQLEGSIAQQQRELKKIAKSELTADQQQKIKLQQEKEKSIKRKEEYERKLRNGEFEEPTPPVRLEKYDAELIRIKREEAKANQEFREKEKEIIEKNKSKTEKIADAVKSAIVTALIGGPKTLLKVASMSVIRPVSETVRRATLGKVFDLFFPNISKAAKMGGEGSSVKSMAKGFEAYFRQMGQEKLDKKYEKANEEYQNALNEYANYSKTDNPDPKKLDKLKNNYQDKLIKAQSYFIYKFIGGSSLKDAWQALVNRSNEIERQFGKVGKESIKEGDWLKKASYIWEFLGRSHSAAKTFSGRYSFASSFMSRLEGAVERGEDISSPDKILEIAHESYLDWERGKYQQSNMISDKWADIIGSLIKKTDTPEQQKLSKALKYILSADVAVTRVPVNILHEALVEYTFGAFKALRDIAKVNKEIKAQLREEGFTNGEKVLNDITYGTSKEEFKNALKERISLMDRNQAATIARCFTKGGVGLGLYALALISGAIQFGIFPYKGQKKKKEEEELEEKELNPGQVVIGKNKFGETASSIIEHVPATFPMFMGLGMAQMYKDEINKGKTTPEAAAKSLYTHLQILESDIPQSKVFSPLEVVKTFYKSLRKRGEEIGLFEEEEEIPKIKDPITFKNREMTKEEVESYKESINNIYEEEKSNYIKGDLPIWIGVNDEIVLDEKSVSQKERGTLKLKVFNELTDSELIKFYKAIKTKARNKSKKILQQEEISSGEAPPEE